MRQRVLAAVSLALVGLAGASTSPFTTPGYLVRQAYFQGEQLWGRVSFEQARTGGALSDKELARLDEVTRIKAYAGELGLATEGAYDTVNPTWRRTIYNVSACPPLALKPVRWSFPIVGRVPYLGFFRIEDARVQADHLRARGLDVYVRTAGAYSSLGWFDDPLLPHMLAWDDARLSNTLLHELAHRTLWIPGSVAFNESFANFVGDEASLRYLEHTHGSDSKPVRDVLRSREDGAAWRELMHAVYGELDAVYRSDLPRGEKLREKHRLLATLPTRTAALDLHRSDRYVRAARTGDWNNARLVQFRTYNRSRDWFALLLAEEQGDLGRFMSRVEQVARGSDDPYRALAEAVGAVYEDSDDRVQDP